MAVGCGRFGSQLRREQLATGGTFHCVHIAPLPPTLRGEGRLMYSDSGLALSLSPSSHTPTALLAPQPSRWDFCVLEKHHKPAPDPLGFSTRSSWGRRKGSRDEATGSSTSTCEERGQRAEERTTLPTLDCGCKRTRGESWIEASRCSTSAQHNLPSAPSQPVIAPSPL